MGSRYCKSFRKLELPVTPKMSLSFVPLAVSRQIAHGGMQELNDRSVRGPVLEFS